MTTISRLSVGIGALAALLILMGAWEIFPHRALTPAPRNASAVGQASSDPLVKPVVAPSKSVKVSSLWTRPIAELASRNSRRSGFAWIWRQLGASEKQLDRLADKDLVGLIAELKRQAQGGDPASINILGELAYQNCYLGRSEEVLNRFESAQIADANALPAMDLAWFTAALREDVAFDQELGAVCKQLINQEEILSWVSERANQGDGASLWLLFRSADNMTEMQERLRQAAAAGFPQAQFELAWAIISGQEGAAGTGAEAVTAGELLRQSADQLPRSEAELALCEYSGCGGVTTDIDSAIGHAREAAQRGVVDAMVAIGPHLPAGQINPDEVAAWSLVSASLQQQGCAGNGLNARSMKIILNTLSATNISPQARILAEQYWQTYGTQMLSNLGCTS